MTREHDVARESQADQLEAVVRHQLISMMSSALKDAIDEALLDGAHPRSVLAFSRLVARQEGKDRNCLTLLAVEEYLKEKTGWEALRQR